MHQRQIPIPRGKTLGGTSAINAMVHIRGQQQDYDEWCHLGNVGWGYDDVLPFFRQSETNLGTHLDPSYNGTKGPLTISDRAYTHPLSDPFVKSAVAIGIAHNSDFNGQQQAGAGRYQVTQKSPNALAQQLLICTLLQTDPILPLLLEPTLGASLLRKEEP